jgi:hypothetical protein
MAPNTLAHKRTSRSRPTAPSPVEAGLPDPRPLTDYTAFIEDMGTHWRLTITLDQPCIIRQPKWWLVDYRTGETSSGANLQIEDNTRFTFDFPAELPETFNFVEAPYQDMQVQNFQGGFVRPGAKWMRY